MNHSSGDSFQTVFPGQRSGEHIEFIFRQHLIVMRKALLAAVIIIIVSELPLLILPTSFFVLGLKVFWAGLLICAGTLFYAWVGWHYSVYILTDSRLVDIRQKGFFDRTVNEMTLENVQSINFEVDGFQATVLKYGKITIRSYAGNWELKFIPHTEAVYERIKQVMRNVVPTRVKRSMPAEAKKANDAKEA